MAVPLHRHLLQFAEIRKQQPTLSGDAVASALRSDGICTLLKALPSTSCAAVVGDPEDVRSPLTHFDLQELIKSLSQSTYGIQPTVRVGVVVSNGPELAVLLVALMALSAVVPINSAGSLEEFTKEILSTGVELLITDDGDSQRLAALTLLSSQLALPLLVLTKDSQHVGSFRLAQAFHISTRLHQETGITDKTPASEDMPRLEMITVNTEVCSHPSTGQQSTDTGGSVYSDQSFLAALPDEPSGLGSHYQPLQQLVSFRSSQLLEPCLSKYTLSMSTSQQLSLTSPHSSKDYGAVASNKDTSEFGWHGGMDTAALAGQLSTAGGRRLQGLQSFRFNRSLQRQQSSMTRTLLAGRQAPLGSFKDAKTENQVIQSMGSCMVAEAQKYNTLEDVVLILQTSGSTGSKKVVPYTLEAVLVGCCAIATSMELKPSDMAINMMPLFHAGGIFRNILAPLLAGGSTCCLPMFDPCQFWQVAGNMGTTWYYASPTMHMAILDAINTMDQLPAHSIRLIANAAGPLLPATAESLKVTFRGAAILPSYGMTECMPISAPPSNYKLEKPGSSGLPLGPDICIGNDKGDKLQDGVIGEILIKGLPVFKGYDGNEQATAEAFVQGRFKTGDLGYQDSDGHLFITGRSKDVINRGGEIISPAEVESAAMRVPGIRAAAAFPVGHDKLQECVGLVVVPQPEAADPQRRPVLPEMIECLSELLHPSKWPFMLVYMDQLPKGPTGKVVRTGLAKRLALPELTDRCPMADRHYEATAPPASAPVTSEIPAHLVPGMAELLQQKGFAGPTTGGGEGYIMPSTRLEQACVDMVAQVVGMEPASISADADFFLIGGSSMNASQLAALLRKKFQVSWTGLTVFNYRTPSEMANYLLEQKPELQQEGWLQSPDSKLAGPGTARLAKQASSKVEKGLGSKAADPSLRPLVLLLQAIPLFVLTPVRRVCGWMLFIFLWFIIANTILEQHGHQAGVAGQIWALIVAIFLARMARSLVLPFVGIAAKWLVVGRYKEGRYKLWGAAYLRWWMVDKVLLLTGPGFFSLTPGLTRLYLRLMGAKVGKGVTVNIEKTRLREFDLLTLKEGVVIDARAYLRCFAADNGEMLLAPITLGSNSCVSSNGVIPPGTLVPPSAGIGPNSCALEGYRRAADLRRFCRNTFPAPPLWMQLLLGHPLRAVAKLVSLAPVLVLLLVALPRLGGTMHQFYTWQAVIDWLVEPWKIMIYLLGAICYSSVCPIIYLAMVICMKRVIIGRFAAGPRGSSNWQLFRHWFMALLLPDASLGGVLPLIGTHWELVSCIYRALGSKVGKRVFWPGSGLLGVVEYDLLTIEDDAVFGSRSTFMLSDAEACLGIKICAGGNVADRCVVLPGACIGVNACLGTGGVLNEGQYLEPGAVAVGCQDGTAVVITPGSREAAMASTIKPFGSAQYLRQANYWLPPVWLWVMYSWLTVVAEAVFTRSRMVVTWLIVYRLLDFANQAASVTMVQFFGTMLGVYSLAHIVYSAASLVIVIGSKWLVIGKRQPGDEYSWDVSSYCARWNMHLALQPFKGKMLDCLDGSAYNVFYFRALGCKIGRGVCLYPTGSDPVMTEPELVTIGDNACINYAFVVNHINTRGQFSLQRIVIGNNTTLRAWARLMAGGTMEDNSVMLEHTLALPGETVDSGMAWQGWPVCSVAPVKVMRLQSNKTLSKPLSLRLGTTAASLALSAAAPGPAGKQLPQPPLEHGVSGLSSLALRKSLRISNSVQVYNASGLAEHLGETLLKISMIEQQILDSCQAAAV